jgi:hypothetical protein
VSAEKTPKLDLGVQALLLVLPFVLSRLPGLGGESDVSLPWLDFCESGLGAALALVLAFQTTMTVLRLPARDEALVARRSALGQRLFFVLALVFTVYATWSGLEIMRGGVTRGSTRIAVSFGGGSPLADMLAIVGLVFAVVLLAFVISRRGQVSGILVLVCGFWLAEGLDRLVKASPPLVVPASALLLVIFFSVAVGRRGRASLAPLRERDRGFVVPALGFALTLASELAFDIHGIARGSVPEVSRLLLYVFFVVVGVSVVRLRRFSDLRELRWAGFTALFHEHELALAPWAFASLAWWASYLRLELAETGQDPTLSRAQASSLVPVVPLVAFFGAAVLVVFGLPGYLRFVSPDSPTPEETSSRPPTSSTGAT